MSFLTVEREIENALFDFIVEATGLTADQIHWAKSNIPRPKKPYISIRNFGLEKISHGREVGFDEDGYTLIDADYENTFLVTSYRDDPAGKYTARSIMMELAHSFSDLSLVHKHFSNNNIGYSSQTNITDVSIPIDSDWEQRYSINLNFNIVIRNLGVIQSGEIETVNISDQVLDPADNEVLP